MAKAEQDDGAAVSDGCPYQTDGVLCRGPGIGRDCAKCGWNSGNGVRERRVAEAMREYRRKLRAGEIKPAIW